MVSNPMAGGTSRQSALPRVYVIGMGMGNPATLTGEARDALATSELIIGSKRLLQELEDYGARKVALVASEAIAGELKASGVHAASVVMSGDVGLYSGATGLYPLLEGMDVRVIPGISSLSYLCARLRTTWQDARVVSAHGRKHNAVGVIQSHAKTFVLTGGRTLAQDICAQLCERGLGDVHVAVGERLSYPDERIVEGTACQLASCTFGSLAVVLVTNDAPIKHDVGGPSLPDSAFVRDKVPMTKQEVRQAAICKLCIQPDDVVWDVGAGTGSVSMEAARAAYRGLVLAIERDERACALIEQNKIVLGLPNVRLVRGVAPEVLQELPAPDCVFVGGSSGRLRDILEAAVTANPAVRLCVSAITLETLSETLPCLTELGAQDIDITQLMVAKGQQLGGYHLMRGNNPVYLICAKGPAAHLSASVRGER